MRLVQPLLPAPVQGYGWPHRVGGVVQVEGVASVRRVVVLDRETMALAGSQLSAADGAFLFRGLPELPNGHSGWLVIAQDNILSSEPSDGNYNAVVADLVQPETGD